MLLGKRHIVRPGESLKSIAYAYYMDEAQWPVIFEHNQLFQVKGHTGREIISPDMLFVGQVIYVPDIPPAPRTPKQTYSGMLKRPQPPEWRRRYMFVKAPEPANSASHSSGTFVVCVIGSSVSS